jgi:hypothetical protein
MVGGRSLGRQFGWLWTAYAVNAYGSGLGFGAFPPIAILVLHAGPAEVSALSASGLAVGAVVAVPLGPWMELRRKRPEDLLVANGRFESTTWTAIVVGPPLGGAAVGLFGPVTTMLADAVSYLLSAAGICAIGGREPSPVCTGAFGSPGRPTRAGRPRLRARDVSEGWRYILAHPTLRPVFFNGLAVGGLLLAVEPLIAVLLLGHLGFTPWQYGLAFAAPCVGGLIGVRLSRRLVARYGQHRVMRTAGTLCACWPIGLAFVRPGVAGLPLVISIQLGLVTCMGVFNPVLATYRLNQTPADRVARTLSAWSVSSSGTTAALTALWGLLASVTSPRTGIAIAGLLLLATPLPLPRHDRTPQPARELARSQAG